WLALLQPSERGLSVLALATNAAMLALALVALFGYLAPAYARPPAFAEGEAVPNEVNARFDVLATLRGYELSATTLRPGEALDIDLYWEVNAQPPGDFVLFVHLVDETRALVAQRDSHPGTGTFPTRFWRPGDRFVDSIRLYLPETAYTPETATLSVGLAGPDYRLGITGPQGEGWGDALPLATLELLPATHLYDGAEEIPNPLDQNYENQLRLMGYAYDTRQLAPGEPLAVTLYWRALPDVREAYRVQLQLLDAADSVRATS